MKRSILYMIILFGIFSSVYAQENLYFGGSIGSSFLNHTLGSAIDDAHIDNAEIDENNFAWKAYLGYKFGNNFGIEGGYRNTGKAEDKADDHTISSRTKGWDVAALGKIDVSILFAFAKAGAFFYNTENSYGELIYGENETAFLWGVGVGVNLGGLAIRLEWEDLGTSNPESAVPENVNRPFHSTLALIDLPPIAG